VTKFTFEAFATSLLIIYYFSRKDQSFIKGKGALGSPLDLSFVGDQDARFLQSNPQNCNPRSDRNTQTSSCISVDFEEALVVFTRF
jgi:hypothetical protein